MKRYIFLVILLFATNVQAQTWGRYDWIKPVDLNDGTDTGSVGECVAIDDSDTTKFQYKSCGSGGAGSNVIVQEEDVTLGTSSDTLDFGAGFDLTESPSGEANITLDLTEITTKWTESSFTLYPSVTQDTVIVGGDINLNSSMLSVRATEDTIQMTVECQESQTSDCYRVQDSGGTTLQDLDSSGNLTVSGNVISGGSGQSTLSSGLSGNTAGGATASDDLLWAGDTEPNLFLVDASADNVKIGDSDTNYMQISNAGVVTFVGSADIDLPADSVDDADLNTTWSIPLLIQSAKLGGSFITNPMAIDGSQAVWMGLFDASQTESALWQFRYPDYCGGTPVANLTYSMASATSNNVDLEVDVMAVADGETPTTASFDTTNEVTGGTTVPGTAGLRDTVSITLSNNDSIAAGEMMIVRINRDHDDADDTATGDLELLEAEIECTR